MITRRQLLKGSVVAGAGLCLPLTRKAFSALGDSCTTDGGASLAKFVDPLPIPKVLEPTRTAQGIAHYEVRMTEFAQKLHRDLGPTTLWGYEGVYPGPTIEARTNERLIVKWINNLRDRKGMPRRQHYLPVDASLHGPDKHGSSPRTVVHLHGGHVPAASDGYPEDTFLPGQFATYDYPNGQNAST
ncbi:MAG: multicopper oxidase domain-containing protein, partial [Deltaproteobacteria bacterium]|nr:multicopper oxidase domain-containing protein [Deltaproteobacteria bacterium]